MENEEEFRQETIYEIKRLKIKIKGLYGLVFTLSVFITYITILTLL